MKYQRNKKLTLIVFAIQETELPLMVVAIKGELHNSLVQTKAMISKLNLHMNNNQLKVHDM